MISRKSSELGNLEIGWMLIRKLGGRILNKLTFFDFLLSGNSCVFDGESEEIIARALNSNLNVGVFVHYSEQMQIDEFDLVTINELSEAFPISILITTSGISNQDAIPRKTLVLQARNFGRDLGVIRDFMKISKEVNFLGSIFYLNNSLIWESKNSLREVVNCLLEKPSNLVVCTESNQGSHHFQSYMYLINDPQNFCDAVKGIRNYRFKRTYVEYGEKMISGRIKSLAMTVQVLFPLEEALRILFDSTQGVDSDRNRILIKRGFELNPSQHLWKELQSMGLHGYKRSLIAKNPAGLVELPLT